MEEQARVVVVAPLGPRREARHVQAALTEHGRTVDGVESIPKVHLQKAFVRVAGVALHPLPGGVNGGFCAEWDRNPNLEGPQVLGGGLAQRGAQAFAGETAPSLALCNRANIVTTRETSSSFLGLPSRILHTDHKKELLRA